MRRAGGPGVRGLRDHGVEALPGELQGAARVVQMHTDPGVGERVPVPLSAQAAVGPDHLGLQLHHVDLLDRRRNLLERQAGAEPDDEERSRLGLSQQREKPEGAGAPRPADARTAGRDDRLGQAVDGQPPAPRFLQQHHRRAAAHSQVHDVSRCFRGAEGRESEDSPWRLRRDSDHRGDPQHGRGRQGDVPRTVDECGHRGQTQARGHDGGHRAR